MLEYIDLSNNVSVLSPDNSYIISNPINATLSVPSSSSKYVKVKIVGEVQNLGRLYTFAWNHIGRAL